MAKKETKKKTEIKMEGHKEKTAGAEKDRDCPIHGGLRTRGASFEGIVIRKFPRRVTLKFERMVRSRKYERYSMAMAKIHARLPNCMEDSVQVGDLIRVMECRPLSKIIHFVVVKKIKGKEERESEEKKSAGGAR